MRLNDHKPVAGSSPAGGAGSDRQLRERLPVQLCSPYWTSLEPTATRTRSRKSPLCWPFERPVRAGPVSPGTTESERARGAHGAHRGLITLPSLLRLRSKSYLEGLYSKRHLSIREIARLADASHSGVLEALDRFGIPKNGNRRTHPGQLPFGFDCLNYKLVKNGAEQTTIRMMRQYRAGGLSLREIAGSLNLKLVPTKNNGVWQANTVRGVLARA